MRGRKTLRLFMLLSLLLVGCEKSKQEVEEAEKSCRAIGGRTEYLLSNSTSPGIYHVNCYVKTPDGSKEYRVNPDGSAP